MLKLLEWTKFIFFMLMIIIYMGCTPSSRPNKKNSSIKIVPLIQVSNTPENNSNIPNDTNNDNSDTNDQEIQSLLPKYFATEILRPHIDTGSCEERLSNVIEFCDSLSSSYINNSLSYFNEFLCNNHHQSNAYLEYAFCIFREELKLSFDPEQLPQTVEKSYQDKNLEIVISNISNVQLLNYGYLYEIHIKLEDVDFIRLYLGYNSTSTTFDPGQTKGFMIQGYILDNFLGTRASYTQWDLTSQVQSIKSYYLLFESFNFLQDPTLNSNTQDQIFYTRVLYDKNSMNGHIQSVEIRPQKFTVSPTNFACYKIFALGTKNGNMLIAKTRDDYLSDNFSRLGHDLNSTATSVNDMDGVCLVDKDSTSNQSGSLKNSGNDYDNWEDNIENVMGVQINAPIMDLTCFNLNLAHSAGGLLASAPFSSDFNQSFVDFSAMPNEIFPSNIIDVTLPENFCSRDSNCACQ